MKSYIVFVREIGGKEEIRYVGMDENKAVNIYEKIPINSINYDRWIEIWDEEKQIVGNWKP